MKNILTSIAITVVACSFASAQNAPKEMAPLLDSTFTRFDSTYNLATQVQLSTQLDLIAEKYSDQWVPQYYAAYAKAMMSYMEPDLSKKDMILDQGDEFLAVIADLGVENDHRYVLTALLANARMAVDGEKRWKKYVPIFEENLKKAKELNADNPQIYYLNAVAKFYTPKAFGGGGKKALPYFEKAKALYPKLDKSNILIPHWGEDKTDYYMKECLK